MASFESEAARIIDKFNGGKCNHWKLKIKTLLASMDLWNIMDGSKEPPPFNANSKMLKEYQIRIKKAIFIIGLNLEDNQLANIKSCKRPIEGWKILCNIHKM